MANLTMENLARALDAMAQNVNRLIETQTMTNQKSKNWDDLGKFKNIKIFGGDQREWEEFQVKFRSQIAAGVPKGVEILDQVEMMGESVVEEEDWTQLADQECTEDNIDNFSKKLHNLLLSLTTKEANAVVRRCRGNGLWAWKRMSSSLNPRTLASGIKMISSVLNPGKISNAARADTMIEEWEDKMTKLHVEYDEEISAKMKVAVLYAMLPKDLQERVLDKCAVSWDGTKEGEAEKIYGKVREEVKNIAKSRRDMITPKPMEVDRVQGQYYPTTDWGWWDQNPAKNEEEAAEEQDGEENDNENNINFIGGKGGKAKGKGKGECWTCGQTGHRAAECPKGKGKTGWSGKGGWANNANNQWAGNNKGEGKGAKGGWAPQMPKACFGCGSTTHLMRDCPNNPNKMDRQVQEVREEGNEPEILFIGHLESEKAESQWQEVGVRRRRWPDQVESSKSCSAHSELARRGGRCCEAPPGLERPWIKGFKVLQVDDFDEDSMGEDEVCHVRAVEDKGDIGKEKREHNKKPKKKWASLGVGEIIVDSAADESCWPRGQGDAFETKPSRRNLLLKTANGAEMKHHGEKEVTFRSGSDEDVIGLKFQVTDVRKPLLAVRRLVEKGNVVNFGPQPEQNFIYHPESGKRILMERRGGSFIIKAHFMKEIVDSETDFSRRVR